MNTRPGLSLLEVVLAVLIVGVSVTTLFSLQGVLSRGVFSAHALIDRIPYIRSLFVEADKEKRYLQKEPFKKVIDDPFLTMTYSVTSASSRALKNVSHLMVETVEAQWPTIFGTRTETFTMVRFVPTGGKKA